MSAHAGHSHGSNAGGRRMSTIRITVNIIENDGRLAPPKLADAEVHFTSGELGGLTLFGFAVWRAKADSGQNVTFSSRQFRVRGQRRELLDAAVDRQEGSTRTAGRCGVAGVPTTPAPSDGEWFDVDRDWHPHLRRYHSANRGFIVQKRHTGMLPKEIMASEHQNPGRNVTIRSPKAG